MRACTPSGMSDGLSAREGSYARPARVCTPSGMSGGLSAREDTFRPGRVCTPSGLSGREIHDYGVLGKFGIGRVRAEQKEEIRSSLILELEEKGLAAGNNSTSLVEEEVDKFLQNGHISGTNLDRLERRVFRRTRASDDPGSARDQRTVTSEAWSLPNSVGSRSVGSRTPRPRSQAGSRTPGGSLCLQDMCVEGNPKWSELATYQKLCQEKDKVDKRSQVKDSQQKMRLQLEQQMYEKEMQKTNAFQEEKDDVVRQKVELQAWQDAETTIAEEQKKIAFDVRKEREIQNAVVNAIREDEKRKKMDDDNEQLRTCRRAEEEEKKAFLDKKKNQKGVMVHLMAEWAEDRNKRVADRKQKASEEQLKVIEYNELLDRQEARNKKGIPIPRMNKGEYIPPNKAERRQVERQFDAQANAMVVAANAKALQDEKAKIEKRSNLLQTNQEYLNQQMQEKDNTMKLRREDLQKQKEAVQAETAEFMQSEKHRIEQQRMKNIQYRLELDRQISTKNSSNGGSQRGMSARKSPMEDNMSQAEVAMNRRLLEEARSTLSSWRGKT